MLRGGRKKVNNMEKTIEIFKVKTRHTRYGNNWGSYKLSASNADDALSKAKKQFASYERLESIELVASTR